MERERVEDRWSDHAFWAIKPFASLLGSEHAQQESSSSTANVGYSGCGTEEVTHILSLLDCDVQPTEMKSHL